MTEEPTNKSSGGKSPEGTWAEEISTRHDVYWHNPAKDAWPLTQHTANDTPGSEEYRATPEQLIRTVEALGGVADVIVRTTYGERRDLSPDPTEALAQTIFDDEACPDRTIYEVYIHPNFKP